MLTQVVQVINYMVAMQGLLLCSYLCEGPGVMLLGQIWCQGISIHHHVDSGWLLPGQVVYYIMTVLGLGNRIIV